jgi:feruloyl esterase
LFPGLSPGGEAEEGGWGHWVTGAGPRQSEIYFFGTQFFQNMIYSDPSWDFRKFDPDRDVKAADEKQAKNLNATDPDLSTFQKRGGKLILYHGWADGAIPPVNTINYYQSVQKELGASQVDSFVRLYLVPGMQHCWGGAGPNSFGQPEPAKSVAKSDPQHDIDAALEAWVEKGAAPGVIIASKADGKGGVERTRPLCVYPQIAKYKGTGSTDDARNFTCAMP